jgi:hypothetical protein
VPLPTGATTPGGHYDTLRQRWVPWLGTVSGQAELLEADGGPAYHGRPATAASSAWDVWHGSLGRRPAGGSAVRHAGWLWKSSGRGPRRTWRRQWVSGSTLFLTLFPWRSPHPRCGVGDGWRPLGRSDMNSVAKLLVPPSGLLDCHDHSQTVGDLVSLDKQQSVLK